MERNKKMLLVVNFQSMKRRKRTKKKKRARRSLPLKQPQLPLLPLRMSQRSLPQRAMSKSRARVAMMHLLRVRRRAKRQRRNDAS